MLPRMDDAAEQPGRVDRRKFTPERTLAGFRVHEMKEEAAVLWRSARQVLESVSHPVSCFTLTQITTGIPDTQRTQAEPCGRDACHTASARAVGAGAVQRQTRRWMGLLKKIKAGAALQAVK